MPPLAYFALGLSLTSACVPRSLPGLLESVLHLQPMGGPGLQLYITGYNTIFLFLFACVAYGVAGSLAGKPARLPFIADAADAQVR